MPKPRKGDTVRVKRLATIVAASVALTAVSVSYGVWSAAASRAAVEHATAGALPTLVAAADIRAGDAITAEAVTVQDVPATYRAASALGGEALLETVCERARVVAVGDDATGVQSGSASVTVEVSPEEADAVREAQFAGRVSLVLVAADDAFEEVGADGQDD